MNVLHVVIWSYPEQGYNSATGHFVWLVRSPVKVYQWTFVRQVYYQRSKHAQDASVSRSYFSDCFPEYEQQTLCGALVVTLAMLLRLINRHFIIIVIIIIIIIIIIIMPLATATVQCSPYRCYRQSRINSKVTIFLRAKNGKTSNAQCRRQRSSIGAGLGRGHHSWLWEFGGYHPGNFFEILGAIWRVLVHLLNIIDESYLIISSKSGNREKNGTRRQKRDKTAARLMSKIFLDGHCKYGDCPRKNGMDGHLN